MSSSSAAGSSAPRRRTSSPGAGHRSSLLEAERLAFGATGRNLGYIWLHTRRRGPELDLVMPTRDTLESLPEELGADFGLRTNGGLIYFTTEDQAVVMREFVERRTADGVPMRLLDGDEAREIAPILPDSVIGATFCPLDAQIDSTRYVGAFAAAAQRAGARIVEGTAARTIETDGGRVTRVVTDIGPISAGQVVLAAGAWSPYLAAQLGVEVPIGADAPPDRPDRADGAAARRRAVRTGRGQAVRDLPRPADLPARAVRDGPRGPARARAPRIGLPEGRRLLPPRDRHGLPGLRLEARSRGRLAHQRGHGRRVCPSCARRGSRVPGPASCR